MAPGKCTRHGDVDVPDQVRKVNKNKIIAFTAIVVVLSVVGVVAGVVVSAQQRRNRQQAAYVPPVPTREWKELPALGSIDAQKLLNDTDTPDSIKDLYTFFSDSWSITEDNTKAFLEDLQQQQAATIQGRHLLQNRNTTTINVTNSVDIEPFIGVAGDVLNYLRYQNSEVLLPVLRQYNLSLFVIERSERFRTAMTGFDPDLVQSEVDHLLQKAELDKYFTIVSNLGCANAGNKTAGPVVEAAGRKLLHKHHHHHAHHHHPQARRLHQVTAANTSRPQTLKEMLCELSPWSPSGVKAMTLDGRPLACSAQETSHMLGPAPFNIIVPVVFHCLRFLDADGYLHPMVEDDGLFGSTDAGQRLIDKANKYYEGTGIRFSLKEVRTDPRSYGYLRVSSQFDWQFCALNHYNLEEGISCLQSLSKDPDVASLIEDMAINVFVSGSPNLYCKAGSKEHPYCNSAAQGYSFPRGPWFGVSGADPASWEESVPGQDWLWINYDQFSPAIHNSEINRFIEGMYDGGTAVLAHEIGHYLGLLHTFHNQNDSVPVCDGDGVDFGDGVPDTAASDQGVNFTSPGYGKTVSDLQAWCTEFRKGRLNLDTSYLSAFDSCSGGGRVQVGKYVDPIWNVMNYVPPACHMTFTPNQVSRLQEMVSTYRPKMVAKYAV